MALRSREACALTPSNLMTHRVDEAGIEHDVVDRMMREDDAMALRSHQVSKEKIVCAILAENTEATDLLHASPAYRHRRTEGKLHALEHVGDHNAGRHLDGHANTFQLCPQCGGSAIFRRQCRTRYAAIGARDHPDFRICERRYDLAQILRRNPDVAVADNK